MSNSTGKTDIPSENMKVDSKKKTVPLGTNKPIHDHTENSSVECRRSLLRKDDRAEADNYPDQYRHFDN